MALGFERLPQPAEQSRLERFALEPVQQLAQKNEVVPSPVHGRQHELDPAGQPGAKTASTTITASSGISPVSKNAQPIRAQEPTDCQDRGHDPQADCPGRPGASCPTRPGRPGRSPIARQSPSSSRSSRRSSRGRSSVTASCRSRRVSGDRRREQPGSQCLLAGARAARCRAARTAIPRQRDRGRRRKDDSGPGSSFRRPRFRPSDPPSDRARGNRTPTARPARWLRRRSGS